MMWMMANEEFNEGVGTSGSARHTSEGNRSAELQRNSDNFSTVSGVNRGEMNTRPLPAGPISAAPPIDSRCGTRPRPASPWEYRICIGPARSAAAVEQEVEQSLLETLSRDGWIFISQNQGIFHFKRLKRQ